MSSDLDDFVLRYTVQLSDSLARLEKLQAAMNKVDKQTSKAGGSLKTFATGAAGELDKLTPGISALTNAVKGLGAEFAIAGAAVGFLGAGIKGAMDLRRQFNAQASTGMNVGVSGLRVEDLTRQLIGRSNGRVDRAGANAALEKFSTIFGEGFTDTSGVKRMQLKKLLGVDLGSYDNPTGYVSRLTQSASFLNGQSDAQVAATAKNLGIDPQALLSLAHGGSAIGNISMSQTDAQAYSDASDSLQHFNTELGTFNEKINELEMAFAGPLLPGMTRFVELMTQLSGVVPRTLSATGNRLDSVTGALTGVDTQTGKMDKGLLGVLSGDVFKPDPGKPWYRKGLFGILTDTVMGSSDAIAARNGTGGGTNGEDNRDAMQTVNDFTNGLDSSNKVSAELNQQQTLAMNMFAAAVGQFAGAIDQHQAWAAWAGVAGNAAGIAGSSNAPVAGGNSGNGGLRNNNPGNLEYGPFAKAHGATGSDGRFAIFPSMEAGVAAHTALLDSNYYGKGLDTPRKIIAKYAPASENNQGAYLSFLKSKGFDPDKPITDRAGFNRAQLSFESGYGSGSGIGQSKGSIRNTSLMNQIAAYIGVHPDQLARGDVSKNDANIAISSLEADAIRGIQAGSQRLENPGGLMPAQVAALKNNIQVASQFLSTIQANKQSIVDMQKGDTNLTQGKQVTPVEVVANFHINGSNMDAKTVADEVNRVLRAHMQETVNLMTSGVKG